MRTLGVAVLLLATTIQTKADAPPASECVKEDNITYFGKDPGKNNIVSGLEECINWCGETTECGYWTFDKSVRRCWLKTSVFGRGENPDRISGTKNCASGSTCKVGSLVAEECTCGKTTCKIGQICEKDKCLPGQICKIGSFVEKDCKCEETICKIGQTCLKDGCLIGPTCRPGKPVEKECTCGKTTCKIGEICGKGECLKAPINGKWSQWSSLSPCSVSCGNGTKTRFRTCTNPPPSHEGRQCSGPSEQVYDCNLKQCLPGNCEDGKVDPVDTMKNWTTSCFDVNGNSYSKGESLESCCGCFTFTCSVITENEFLHIFFWEKVRQDSCCQDCDGTVFPAGSVIKSVELDDSCKTTKNTECIYISQEKKAVIQESSSYKACCSNSTGVYPEGTSMLVPATCSTDKCVLSPGRQEAAWISTQELVGCNCCVFNGSLVNDGGWVLLEDGKNATCCDGKLVVGIEDSTPSFPDEKCFLEDTNITFHDLGQNQYGQNTKPVWIIDQGGRRLIETENTRPSVGVSNLGDPTRPVSFSGRVFSNSSDRDVLGMVFGYQNEANFFVVASAGLNNPGPTNWYVGRLHATCGTSCAETTTISDAIWNPTSHPKDITILSSGTNHWSYPNIYRFAICFNPAKLLLSTSVFEVKEDVEVLVLDTSTISAKTGELAVDDMSRFGGFIGVYVDSQALTTWDELDCADCDLTGEPKPPIGPVA